MWPRPATSAARSTWSTRLRYERAAEFLDVTKQLWDSWEDDAPVVDRERGIYADDRRGPRRSTTAARTSGSTGRSTSRARRRATRCWCRPDRPRTARSSPPGTRRPCSPPSRPSPTARPSTRTSSRGSRSTAARPDQLKILPGICPSSARPRPRRWRWRTSSRTCRSPSTALQQLSGMLGTDLTGLPLDGPLPELPEERDINGNKSRFTLVADLARREQLTIRAADRPARRRARATASSPARPSRSPTSWRSGSPRAPPTASTSCRRICPAASTTSSTRWSRCCRAAACSAPSTRAARCATLRPGAPGLPFDQKVPVAS